MSDIGLVIAILMVIGGLLGMGVMLYRWAPQPYRSLIMGAYGLAWALGGASLLWIFRRKPAPEVIKVPVVTTPRRRLAVEFIKKEAKEIHAEIEAIEEEAAGLDADSGVPDPDLVELTLRDR